MSANFCMTRIFVERKRERENAREREKESHREISSVCTFNSSWLDGKDRNLVVKYFTIVFRILAVWNLQVHFSEAFVYRMPGKKCNVCGLNIHIYSAISAE